MFVLSTALSENENIPYLFDLHIFLTLENENVPYLFDLHIFLPFKIFFIAACVGTCIGLN